jgi:transposase-like protein
MSGGYPLGARYDPRAPWNQKDDQPEKVQCPVCGGDDNLVDDTSEGMKHKKLYICEDCGTPFTILNTKQNEFRKIKRTSSD